MRAATSPLWLAALGLLAGACALAGYDFGDYERAPVAGSVDDSGGGGVTSAAGAGPANDATATAFPAAGGEAGDGGAGPESTTFGTCEPRGCFELGLACGPAEDSCGQPLDCGPCFWWFQECVENRCEIPE